MIRALSNVRAAWHRLAEFAATPYSDDFQRTAAAPFAAVSTATTAALRPAAAQAKPLSERYEHLRLRYGSVAAIPGDVVARLVSDLPYVGKVADEAGLLALLTRRLQALFVECERLDLAPPATLSWAAHVFRVRSMGKTVGVLKIFKAPLDAFMREVTAMAHLERVPSRQVRGVGVLAFGKADVGDVSYAYLMMEAPGDLDLQAYAPASVQDGQWHDYLDRLRAAGAITGSLHGAFPPSTHRLTLEATQHEHPAYVRRLLRVQGPLDAFVARGWITLGERHLLQQHLEAACKAYAQADPQALLLGVVHGDCYPANFIINRKSRALHVVDVNTLMWSLGPDGPGVRGAADVRQDVGRFCEALLLQAVRNDLPRPALQQQLDAFDAGYRTACPPTWLPLLHEHAELFRLRYDAVVFEAALRGKTQKTSEAQVRRLLRDVLRRAAALQAGPVK